MFSKEALVCLFLKHCFVEFTSGGAHYRHCLRCRKTELKHYHPRQRSTNAVCESPLAVPARVHRTAWPYSGAGRSNLDQR